MRKIVVAFIVIFSLVAASLVPSPAQAAKSVGELETLLQRSVSSGNWTNAAIYSKEIAVHYDGLKQYDKAAAYYDDSAAYWAKAGHADWGIQHAMRADEIRSELAIYVEKPVQSTKSLAKFEPVSGTYLGFYAAGERDDSRPEVVKDIYGRNHAIYLKYADWRKDSFPTRFAQTAKSLGSAVQIAWQPMNGLDDVLDDEYVRQFAREAKASGVPVFLRFAGEMNGNWVPWGGNPEKYKEKFRLIHNIMEEEAPNVAMVWAPNFLPRHNWDEYYPGDQYVDWVGLSLYTVPFSHGKETLGTSPIDHLSAVYEKYKHKPMMIVEGAVSHYSYAKNQSYAQWATRQIGNMYGFLPKMFPQIKAMTYFNLDTKKTKADEEKHNYDLAGSKIVDQAYQKMIQSPYFIDTLSLNGPNQQVTTDYVSANELKEVSGVRNVFAYVKLPFGQQPYHVAILQGGKKLGESYAQPWEMNIDFSQVNPKEPLTIVAHDGNFKVLSSRKVNLKFTYVNQTGKFSDVNSRHWAYKEIEKAEKEGIVKGYEDGSFRPNQQVTTAEFVTMLTRSYGKEAELAGAPYPQGVVQFMNKMNYPYTEKIKASMNRKEVAEIISATQGWNLAEDDAIRFLLVNGLSKGKDPGQISVEGYKGQDTLTRAEAVTFIANVKNVSGQIMKERPVERSDAAIIRNQYQQKFQ